MSVSRYKFAPFFQNLLVFNDDFPIENIIEKGFGYTIINKKEMDVGIKFKNIWKPFLQDNITRELNFDIPTLFRAKRNLSILLQKLQEILLLLSQHQIVYKHIVIKLKNFLFLLVQK